MTTPALFDMPGTSVLQDFYDGLAESARRHIASGNDPNGHHARQLARALAGSMTSEPGGSDRG